MALLTTTTLTKPSFTLTSSSPSTSNSTSVSSSSSCLRFQHQAHNFRCLCIGPLSAALRRHAVTAVPRTSYKVWQRRHVVCMAPEEEKLTRRSPLDFPVEWKRPKPGRRPDIFPHFSPMKTPLPIPMPGDPPEEEEEKEEEEDDPEKEEEPGKPEKEIKQ